MVVWAIRARRAVRAGDEMAGLALTGIVGCLVSPITWIHHLVWALPAFVLLVDHAFDKSWGGKRERRNMLIFAIITYGILCSRLPWAFHNRFHDFGLLGSNAYVLVLIILLFTLPIRVADAVRPGRWPATAEPTGEDVPDLAEIDRKVTAAFDAKDAAKRPVPRPQEQLVSSVVPHR